MSVTYVERILDINRRATIVILEGYYSGRYPSRIEDIGQSLLLAAPTHKGAVIRLDVGEPICVEVLAEDGVYAFDTHIDAIILEPIPVICVGKPENFSRIQDGNCESRCDAPCKIQAPETGPSGSEYQRLIL